jgi:DNA-binding beta-propeller fold protein YncE
MVALLIAFVIAAATAVGASVEAANPPSLTLEAKIPLGDVSGRIDHIAVDIERQRLFIAELGNDTIGIVDLKEQKTIRTIRTAGEPQGIAYLSATDTIYSASGREGSISLYRGNDFVLAGKITLGKDADNIRIDSEANRLWIGYGSGALTAVDLATRQKLATIVLKAHPESFQLESGGQRIFVNVPDAHEIAVIDRVAGKQLASWPTKNLEANFPMALDVAQKTLLVVFRKPAVLMAIATDNGKTTRQVETCSDADDVFVDSRRSRIYVICGEGVIDVFESGSYRRIERIPTVVGARTAVFVPELDRLFVAVRKTVTEPAAIWVFKP